MLNESDYDTIGSATVYDSNGEKVGKVAQLYVDDETNRPSWLTVTTGLFGTSENFVPLDDSVSLDGDRIDVPYTKEQIKDAPRVDADGHLSPGEEEELYRHYNREYTAGTGGEQDTESLARESDGGQDRDRLAGEGSMNDDRRATTEAWVGDVGDGSGQDREQATTEAWVGDLGDGSGQDRGPTGRAHEDRNLTGTADTDRDTDRGTMTASEERLNVGTEQVEAGRARLRKYTTTERQTVTVPVEKEVLRVDREPVEGETRSAGDIEDTDEVEDVVLREERPVVSKEVHDVERVSVGKQTVTEQRDVSDELKKEHIEVETDADVGESGRRV